MLEWVLKMSKCKKKWKLMNCLQAKRYVIMIDEVLFSLNKSLFVYFKKWFDQFPF